MHQVVKIAQTQYLRNGIVSKAETSREDYGGAKLNENSLYACRMAKEEISNILGTTTVMKLKHLGLLLLLILLSQIKIL